MTKHRRLRILAEGGCSGVVLANGTCPAEEFLAGLDARALAQIDARLGRLTEVGWLRSPDLFRELKVAGQPKVWEVKAHAGRGHRLYLIRHGTDWIATHGGPKPPDRRVTAEVRRSRDIYLEWTT